MHDSLQRITRIELKPESKPARIGTFGPAALIRCAIAMIGSRFKSVCSGEGDRRVVLAGRCTPRRSARSGQILSEPS